MQVSKTCNGFGGMHGQSEKLCAARASLHSPKLRQKRRGPCRPRNNGISLFQHSEVGVCTPALYHAPFFAVKERAPLSNLFLFP